MREPIKRERILRAVPAGLLAAFLVLPAPGGAGAVAATQTRGGPAEWRPWLLRSADEFRLPPPPARRSPTTRHEVRQLLRLQKALTPRIKRRVRFWNGGPVTLRWTEIALEMVKKHRPRPPFSSRGLALLHTAMFDASIAAVDSRAAFYRPAPSRVEPRLRPLLRSRGSSYPAQEAALAGAAETILAALFPNEPAGTFRELADEAVESRLWGGLNYRSDVVRGRRLGRRVAELFLARAATDGSTNTGVSEPRPDGEQYWEPTPPAFEAPTGGPVGTWLPWLMASPGEARTRSNLAPPPAYGSPAFMDELQEVIDVQANLTQHQAEVAVFWDDGPNTYTPPGHWNDIAADLIRTHDLRTAAATRVLAYLNVATADAAIASFEAKYHWWSIRPITAARRLCDGGSMLCTEEELAADPARATHPDWHSFIITPPFPAYPGGHSTFSGAAGEVLGYFFPAEDELLDTLAEEAASSRLYGGIHFRSDNDAGLILGRTIGQMAIARAGSG